MTDILSANLGFPRIGSRRELKSALESHLSGATPADALRATARALRARHWFAQARAGLDHIPANDFSLYDQMLDTIALLGAVPPRFGHPGGEGTRIGFSERPPASISRWSVREKSRSAKPARPM